MKTLNTPDTNLAIALMRTADLLGHAEQTIQDRARTAGHPIKEEKLAIDSLFTHAQETRIALRTLAMRLDRCALDLYSISEEQDQATAAIFAETSIH